MSELRPGYKMTDAGVIPEDWTLETIGSLAKIVNGGTPRTSVSHYWNGGIPWCTPTDITRTDEKYLGGTERTITPAGLVSSSATMLPVGALLLCSRATIGDVKIAATEVCTNQGFKSLVCLPHVNNEFLYYKLLTMKPKMVEKSNGSTFLEISKTELSALPVPMPPTVEEQRAIATALSDTDALLRELDVLLAKKRDIKQGAMQQLLTGKTRLPGFSGAWHELSVGNDSTLKARIGWQGLKTDEYRKTGYCYLVTGTDFINGRINWSSCHFVDIHRYTQDKNIQLQQNDVLVTKDGTIGKVGYVDNLPGFATLNSGVFVIRPKNNAYHPSFIYHILTSYIFDGFLNKLQAGSTISHLYQKDFVGFRFMVPTVAEQKEIATLLSAMDTELAVITEKRDKLRAVKQGMMQELLTGRTRLL